ncbi:hypothetical protein J4402_04025 [Candidatus Pacearchaeota archaeon]|nr:hypothetical protein [Candidatus Pacearchaeota archaeon]
MTDKDAVLKEKVEHSGLFDFAGFYSFAHSWFKEQKYGVNEKKYSEKVKGNARDLRIEWAATKAISDYFKIELDITFEVWGMTEVEVEIDGEKKKMNKGTIGAEIKGTLVKDYDSKWETSPQWRFLREIYNKYLIPARVNSMKGKVEDDVRSFKEELKSFLDLIGKR